MQIKRRQFLLFLGASAGTIALGNWDNDTLPLSFIEPANAQSLGFKPILGVMPLKNDGISVSQQKTAYGRFEVKDDVILPEGYSYQVITAWGDPLGDSRIGYNNDFLTFIPTGNNEGYLVANFEYVSALAWNQTFTQVIGKQLPLAQVEAAVKAAGDKGVNAFALPESDPIKAMIREISKEALIDQGFGVISLKMGTDGKWMRTNSRNDRRTTGITGLEDGRYLKATGPAVSIFRKTSGKGYLDGLGEKVVGSMNNCAGGTSPWGTAFSAEENFQGQVPEPVYADGTSFDPGTVTFKFAPDEILGLGNVFGLAGNKQGWMVEIDPANPNDYGTKHTWLGRFRHEAVAFKAEQGKRLAVYSGCDRRGGHMYKFVSRDVMTNPKDKANSRLMETGMLYGAVFNPDGTGRWVALSPETPINPIMPSTVFGDLVNLPKRPTGGIVGIKTDAEAIAFKQQFSTLGDLYEGTATEKQGAILIDAHFAGNAAGITTTARPEDTDMMPDGSLLIAFTSGSAGSDGGADKSIFKGPNGGVWEYGWVMRLFEDGNDPAAMTFKWSMLATGGEPAEGGLGFANPDNLMVDSKGSVWIVTDMSSDRHNAAVPAGRKDSQGRAISQSTLRGLYGNNSLWYIPTSGANAGQAFLFAYGPMDSELTGPCLTTDEATLFLAAQHPGEMGGTRRNNQMESRQFAMRDTDGQEFMQTRQVPIGSNWPSMKPNDPPKPAIIAVRRNDGKPLT